MVYVNECFPLEAFSVIGFKEKTRTQIFSVLHYCEMLNVAVLCLAVALQPWKGGLGGTDQAGADFSGNRPGRLQSPHSDYSG